MSSGATHDPEEIARVVSRLTNLQEDAANIIELALDADPDWYMWGVLGAIGYAAYRGEAEQHDEHLRQMGGSLITHTGVLDASGEFYQAQEDAMVAALDELDEKLDSQ